ncbi:MAG: hypothetical protein IPL65_14920 [Lewinellaceae bacterium]|nr:hypothetical protein [Lewinellaceae bacterium]
MLRSTSVSGHPLGTVAVSDERFKGSSTHSVAESAQTDDLKLINGVSPFAEQQLHAMGVLNFDQIASWDENTIQAVAAALGFAPEKIREEDWPEQARHLVKTRNKRV